MFLCIYIWTRSTKSFVVVIIIIWYCWLRCVAEPLSVGDGLECCRHLVTRRLSRRMVTFSSLLLKWKENLGNVVYCTPFFLFKNKLKFVKAVVFCSNSTFMDRSVRNHMYSFVSDLYTRRYPHIKVYRRPAIYSYIIIHSYLSTSRRLSESVR